MHVLDNHKGKIIYEMNTYNPPQWGIQWEKKLDENNQAVMRPFWNDKKSITILR